MTTDPRIDAYIEQAAPFARPILNHVRAVVHRALPEIEEGIKWNMPAFMVGGKNVAGMAAFKAHCAVMIHGERQAAESGGMGAYGKVAALSDLPLDSALEAALKESAARAAAGKGGSGQKAKAPAKADSAMPDDLSAALADVPGAREKFDAFPPGAQREYVEWVVSAKRADTRTRRIAATAAQSAEGKRLHWKYEKC